MCHIRTVGLMTHRGTRDDHEAQLVPTFAPVVSRTTGMFGREPIDLVLRGVLSSTMGQRWNRRLSAVFTHDGIHAVANALHLQHGLTILIQASWKTSLSDMLVTVCESLLRSMLLSWCEPVVVTYREFRLYVQKCCPYLCKLASGVE
jgi:hypothetical protein